MGHLLRGLVAVVSFGPLLFSLFCAWRAWRHGSDVPLRGYLLNVAGNLCYGVGFSLVWLGTSDRVQVPGLILILASIVQSTLWSRRNGKLRQGPNSGAV